MADSAPHSPDDTLTAVETPDTRIERAESDATDLQPSGESDTTRFLASRRQSDAAEAGRPPAPAARPFLATIAGKLFGSSRPAHLRAIDMNSPQWVNRDSVTHCPICEVELS
eukprot:1666467-Prymnesium_polylepis.1